MADCHAFCLALEARLLQHPNCSLLLKGEARRLVTHKGKITGVDTSLGLLQADHYVLAAGIQSRDLAATAGIYLPLYPLKGYSLTAPIRAQDRAPEISITDFERKVLYARIGGDLRVAAMVDMVGADNSIDWNRIAGLTRLAREAMPHGADYEQATAWAGLRPATPNSAPLVGASKYTNSVAQRGPWPAGLYLCRRHGAHPRRSHGRQGAAVRAGLPRASTIGGPAAAAPGAAVMADNCGIFLFPVCCRMSTPSNSAACPCGGASYASCCGPYIAGDALPPTAEALMRSRYTAFTLRDEAVPARHLACQHPSQPMPYLPKKKKSTGWDLR